MSDLEETAQIELDARSRQLQEAFEAYYAKRERRRLSEEALARRRPRLDGRGDGSQDAA
jgi:hypothetical protein